VIEQTEIENEKAVQSIHIFIIVNLRENILVWTRHETRHSRFTRCILSLKLTTQDLPDGYTEN
jgi:hypothetical protein